MATIITTAEAAERLGVSTSLIQKLAKKLNVGQLLPGGRGVLIFSESDIRKMEGRKIQRGPEKKVKK